MIHLHYRMRLSPKAQRDLKGFWAWLEHRESFFYDDLPMVKRVQWFYSVVGDVYVIENIASFDDEAAFGAYRAALAQLKSDDAWESERVSQSDWWEFLDTRLTTDPPVDVGFNRNSPDATPRGT